VCFESIPDAVHGAEHRPGTYMLIDGDDVVYVGSSRDVVRRLRKHLYLVSSFGERLARALGVERAREFVKRLRVCIHYVESVEEARKLETTLIRLLKPRLVVRE